MSQPVPSAAQKAWSQLGYGLFLHFGPNTLAGVGWGDGKFPAAQFDVPGLDTDQWADLAAAAGMKYAVLTAKHHDGFCLWPSKHTDYCTRFSPGQPDVVARFVESFTKVGIRPGLYYSLWDRNYPRYEDDSAYADFMFAQMQELLTHYGPIVELWFDGGWDKDYPTREWEYNPAWETDPAKPLTHGRRWRWRELYTHIHKIQPDCIVIQNSSSDRPGQIKYHPVDGRTSEHLDFVYKDRLYSAVTDNIFVDDTGKSVYVPLEYSTSINPKWFWCETEWYVHPSPVALADWRRRARSTGANFLLNIGPNKHGKIPEVHRAFLAKANQLG